MSEKFSVEDILNEVKSMTGSHYLSGNSAEKSDIKTEKASDYNNEKEFKKPTDNFENPDNTAFDEPISNHKKSSIDISKMSPDEFFKMIEENTQPAAKTNSFNGASESVDSDDVSESGIVGGFKVRTDIKTDIEKSDESEKDVSEFSNNKSEDKTDKIKKSDFSKPFKDEDDASGDTIVFNKNDVLKKSEEINSADSSAFMQNSQDTEKENNKDDIFESGISLKNHPFKEHKPEHLLKPDEILNNSINQKTSFRFSDKVKDLTKRNSEKSNKSVDKFSSFKKPALTEDEVKTIEQNNVDEVTSFISSKFTQGDLTENDSLEVIEEIPVESKEYDKQDENVSVPFESGLKFTKSIEEDELGGIEKSEPKSGFARKTARRIEEYSFDYSEDDSSDQEVIDDYCNIDDEEAVRFDLDLSLKKVSKRLALTIITFIFGFIITVLPAFDMDFISIVSPNENLTGFLVANSVILLTLVIINISSFLRGLGSFITLKPDADSAVSLATLFVVAQNIIAFIPKNTAAAGKLPFFTAALVFSYILILMGKKSMVSRIRSNFRLVATSSVKQSCFAADERMGDLLENDDFIGVPYVACSKSVINLHNYLRNSYCEDPSDNIARIFAPIGFIVSLITLGITYFMTKDVVSALAYAAAVSLVSVPASAVLSMNSPFKKTSDIFRQRDGLISGFEAVNEFADTDCITFDAEELFPAGSVELLSLRAIGDISIEDIILKSAALTINAGGPLADVFDKIIDGRRKMLPPVTEIIYEDGLGLTGKVDGKTVRIGNRRFIDSYGIYGLSDDSVEAKAKKGGFFVVYTAVEDEVCGMFAVKYKSIDPDIEDGLYELVSNGITIALKTNDPNITPQLIEKVFEIPSDYVIIMESHTAEYYDNITRPSKNGNSILAYSSSNSSVFASLVVACKKLKAKISAAVLIQTLMTILGFGSCMVYAVLNKGFEFITPFNIISFQLAVAVISHFISSFIKRIK